LNECIKTNTSEQNKAALVVFLLMMKQQVHVYTQIERERDLS